MRNLILGLLVAAAVTGCKKAPPDGVDTGARDTCALRLERIQKAKEIWAEKFNRATNDTPTADDLSPYMRGFSPCPAGGTYTIGEVGAPPKCSIPEHQAYFEQKLKEPAG